MNMNEPPDQSSSEIVKVFLLTALIAIIGGALLVALPYGVTLFVKNFAYEPNRHFNIIATYNFSLIFLLPFIQSLFAGFSLAPHGVPWSRFWMGVVILIFDFSMATFLMQEGYICLLMASPLFILIVAIGLWFGSILSRLHYRKIIQASVIPLTLVFVPYDTSHSPVFQNQISDAVTINASPEEVWQYIIQYPINEKPPEYWLWKIGLPAPIQSIATEKSVGAVRKCVFTKGITFDEEITELIPNKVLTFKVTKQLNHPEIIGHFNLDKGQLYLEDNKDGTTTVIATSWYSLYVDPASYFDWWATDIVRNVHFRVLSHMKELAEKNSKI
jgi:hypothetical protein